MQSELRYTAACAAQVRVFRVMRIDLCSKDTNIYTSPRTGVQLSRHGAFYLARQLRQRYAKRLYQFLSVRTRGRSAKVVSDAASYIPLLLRI